jgi:hypothetical protein
MTSTLTRAAVIEIHFEDLLSSKMLPDVVVRRVLTFSYMDNRREQDPVRQKGTSTRLQCHISGQLLSAELQITMKYVFMVWLKRDWVDGVDLLLCWD